MRSLSILAALAALAMSPLVASAGYPQAGFAPPQRGVYVPQRQFFPQRGFAPGGRYNPAAAQAAFYAQQAALARQAALGRLFGAGGYCPPAAGFSPGFSPGYVPANPGFNLQLQLGAGYP